MNTDRLRPLPKGTPALDYQGRFGILDAAGCVEPSTLERRHLTGDAQMPSVRDGAAPGSPELVTRGTLIDVAALYVETDGCYFGLPNVEPWDIDRDARQYAGPHPVVAHPPCQRWGRFWHGSTRKPHQFELGDDGGCFKAALDAVIRWGGVLEHPAHSRAWDAFGLVKPPRDGGWVRSGVLGATCYVEQGFYGHLSRKPTWLYAAGHDWIDLKWGVGEQRIHPVALAKHGYEKARRIGMMAMVGGKDKTKIRNATPIEFRDLLISIAATARR